MKAVLRAFSGGPDDLFKGHLTERNPFQTYEFSYLDPHAEPCAQQVVSRDGSNQLILFNRRQAMDMGVFHHFARRFQSGLLTGQNGGAGHDLLHLDLPQAARTAKGAEKILLADDDAAPPLQIDDRHAGVAAVKQLHRDVEGRTVFQGGKGCFPF